MKYLAVSPDGTQEIRVEITKEGTKVCQKGSPEVCYKPNDPQAEGIKLILERLWHEGWKIDVE